MNESEKKAMWEKAKRNLIEPNPYNRVGTIRPRKIRTHGPISAYQKLAEFEHQFERPCSNVPYMFRGSEKERPEKKHGLYLYKTKCDHCIEMVAEITGKKHYRSLFRGEIARVVLNLSLYEIQFVMAYAFITGWDLASIWNGLEYRIQQQ